MDNIDVRNYFISNKIGKLIIQELERDGNTSRRGLKFHPVFYKRNIVKKSVTFVITDVRIGVQSVKIRVVVIICRRPI